MVLTKEHSMVFQVSGLSPKPFQHLYGKDDAYLALHRARRVIADKEPGFPERIELRDAKIGESLLLVNFEHQSADSPYRSCHAIYVLEGAQQSNQFVDEIPAVLTRRLLSLRGFSTAGMLIAADVLQGSDLEGAISTFFANPAIAYLHVHNARQGCFAALVERT
jgi:Protein of unknown function (DUF1203)